MKLPLAIFILLLASIGGGFAFLSTWDIPAPSSTVEKVIPNDRFQK
jgi:hypothetical protein